jgi:hypothetical protein
METHLHKLSRLFRRPGEGVSNATPRTCRSTSVLPEALFTEDPHEVGVRRTGVQEQWEMMLLSETELEAEAGLLGLNVGEVKTIVVCLNVKQVFNAGGRYKPRPHSPIAATWEGPSP